MIGMELYFYMGIYYFIVHMKLQEATSQNPSESSQ